MNEPATTATVALLTPASSGSVRLSSADDPAAAPLIDPAHLSDASVMPCLPRGNTRAPTLVVAERAADFLRGRADG
ncbi:hypothetical protein GTQ99_21545 [Kineococcus sp. T13]|uniref:hypothetical protein n=1 Tax=Kineococcus vitellinus TaxID=2696565 RepID=UPI001412B0C2|nr:hypothetical protein [Kineococcus vitellinus]NAZ77972.1 hypothetical protein [Kineococcus vitellinus]